MTWKQRCRIAAGCDRYDSFPPVKIVDGKSAPELRGESYYWTWTGNPSGTRVWSNRGRSLHRTYYHGSTRYVTVGRDWLAKQSWIHSYVFDTITKGIAQ